MSDEIKLKVCSMCKEKKAAFEFNLNKRAWDGLQSSCKACAKKQNENWVKKMRPKNIDKLTWRNNFRNM